MQINAANVHPPVNVNLIRCWEGPRHKKLERLWAYFGHFRHPDGGVHIWDNPGARDCHAYSLNRLWEQEQKRPERYAILTEFDFLPRPQFFADTSVLDADHPVAAVEYVTRDPYTRKLQGHGYPGAWYILVDKDQCPEMDFTAGGPCNDPANRLHEFVAKKYDKSVRLLFGEDCYPTSYGVRYPQGTHLFFSRHYNDPPQTFIAGFCLWDILKKTDDAIDAYVRTEL